MSNNNYVTLYPLGLTRGLTHRESYILLMRDAESGRTLPLLLNTTDFKKIHDLISSDGLKTSPHLSSIICDLFQIEIDVVIISTEGAGKYTTHIVARQGGDVRETEADLSTGLYAAMTSGAQIEMLRTLFDALTRHGGIEEGGKVAIPIVALTDELLGEALQSAIENDNYELAAVISNECNKRKQEREKNHPEEQNS